MRITINGIEYEAVDTQIIEGMDIGCKDCDIFKAKRPKSPAELPLCYERGNGKTRQSCHAMACRGYKRIFKKMENADRRKALEAENTEFDYGHNVKHYSED